MSKKDLNIQYKVLDFSILDNDMIDQCDKHVHKIFLYNVIEFQCSIQAWYDIADDILQKRELETFCHLLNIYKDNIYIANTNINTRLIPDKYVESFTNKEIDDEWNPVSHTKKHIQYLINLLISADFNINDSIQKLFEPVYIYNHKTIRMLYSMLGNSFHYDNGLFYDIMCGKYRQYKEYEVLKEEILELLKEEMD